MVSIETIMESGCSMLPVGQLFRLLLLNGGTALLVESGRMPECLRTLMGLSKAIQSERHASDIVEIERSRNNVEVEECTFSVPHK